MKTLTRRAFMHSLALGTLAACAAFDTSMASASRQPVGASLAGTDRSRPHILLIVTDDQRSDSMEFMPLTTQRIFNEGVRFTNAYVTTPRCGPSRASIYTGLYAHNSGVQTNQDPLTVDTFVHDLHDSGYRTAMIGKYLNSWKGKPRPEFDRWVSYTSKPRSRNPTLNIDGEWIEHEGLDTFLLRDYALEFLDVALKDDKPFFLLLSPFAPHSGATPAPGDELLYDDLPPYRPPSFNEIDMSDKAQWLRNLEPVSVSVDDFRLTQLRSLRSLDQAIDALLDKLEEHGALDNTVIMFISDNGLFLGEHRLRGKRYPYEEASRIPFAVRFPPLVPEGQQTAGQLVANIDIAPTLYELAGLPTPASVDGKSLVSLLQGEPGWRNHLLLQGMPEPEHLVFTPGPGYRAIRFEHYLYIDYDNDIEELYDLVLDPFQLSSKVEEKDYADILQTARNILLTEYPVSKKIFVPYIGGIQ